MKFTQEQLMNIIKEEIAAVLGEEVSGMSYADPRIPRIIVSAFLEDAGNSLSYFQPDNQKDSTGAPARASSGATDSPQTVGKGMLDVFRFLPTSIEETIRAAIKQSGADERVQALMDMVFTTGGTYDSESQENLSMPQIIEMAKALLDSLESVKIPNAEDLDLTIDTIRDDNSALADDIAGKLA